MSVDIREFANLKADWDSYGAKPITEAAIEAALRVKQAVKKGEFWAVPTNGGGVQIGFCDEEFTIEIGPDGKQVD